jgi:3',5'-cyclic AMP phosphodiesterase CpdA
VEQPGQYPDPSHTIAHLSDPHLLAGGALQYGHVDTEARLAAALDRLGRLDPVPEALVFTGDLADKGEPKAYQRLRELVEPVAAAVGAQVIWVMGNHDDRTAYARQLFDLDPEADAEASQDRVHDVGGLRVVSLDSTVPGWHHGELRDAQLTWLADVLATPAPHGTVLAMHHPPIPVPMMRLAEIIELKDQQPLAEVLAGSDVRAIIGGHFHFTSYSTFAGIPVSVASATCYTSELAPDNRLLSSVDAHQAFSMVHVYVDRVVHSVVPIHDGPEIAGYGLEMAAPFEALSVDERFAIVSRKDSPLYAGD